MPVVLPDTPDTIARAAATLRAGGLVAFPTETVYGLGADTFNANALRLVYARKGRPSDNPLIAHVDSLDQAMRLCDSPPPTFATLARAFWPGPLTLIVRRREGVPPEATAGRDTIAIRHPNHPTALALLEAFAGPISAPSANRSGHISPTTAAHVAADFSVVDDLIILDGGSCTVGIESTVVDLTGERPGIVRPGSVTADDLQRIVGPVDVQAHQAQTLSPGTSLRHYAPRTPTRLATTQEIEAMASTGQLTGHVLIVLDATARQLAMRTNTCAIIALPDDAAEYAAKLYGVLRAADQRHGREIVIENPQTEGGVWDAIRDRLHRATSRSAA